EVAAGHLERARAWAASKAGESRTPIVVLDPLEGGLRETVREATGGGVDVVLEMSGAPPAINNGLELLYPGGEMMMLGIPSRADLTLDGFSRNVIFKGLTLHGVVGRRMFATWEEMLGMLERGLDLEHIVTHRLPLSGFHHGIALLDAAEAHKVVLDPSA
ncbi:MAG: zinc-binding dehydrogenase, partial [Planctomycetes bacterium]|nr:zinc-binding dehydrogenase [Planctomycetota bacterium]